jgi:hypothetical protein
MIDMETIALQTHFSASVNLDQVRQVVDTALRREADLAAARRAYFERACRVFEQQHQLSSDEFMRQFEAGQLGDAAEYFDWYAAKRGLEVWNQRYQILSGIAA